ncbi:MAG: capsular biosynthesis protein [Muribaculaceae bacterium]|nr:capsular biosynthesis protein [Bacteroidales bacterium]MBD5304647.1 capsular biosynthesis protein [Bacteroides sp.]MBD5341437.1 capsular biosynthesis protein [Bacteroides sp.]MDE6072529.1 capsular biosynthesis protein [Muribaculaceae bacterium]
MWLFNKTKKLSESGMFDGFTDWHSHILPGVDDGIAKLEDSLAVLKRYEEAGIRKIWLTPHVMEDFPNTPDSLRERFGELKEAYNGNIELRLASENMLDSLFEERLEKNEFLPIGEDGKHLLVETSYMNPPYAMEDMIEKAQSLGYTLILAHPERYRYMEEADYRQWKDRGLLFQTNFMSLVEAYGETARKKAEWLLKEGMIDICGSDVHRLNFFDHFVEQSPKKSSYLEMLKEVAQNPKIS